HHLIALDIDSAWRADRAAAGDVEHALMEWADDVLAFNEPIRKASFPVRTCVMCRVDLAANVVQADRLSACLDKQRPAFGDVINVGDLRQLATTISHFGSMFASLAACAAMAICS